MMIRNAIEMENGMTALEILDVASGLISNYVIPTGTITQFMRELRDK